MKKIIHLSDLHIGFSDCSDRFSRIVRDINFLKEPASNYVVVVTGDLVDSAFDGKNYGEAKALLDCLRGFDVLVVPGNHDYGSGSLGLPRFVKEFKKTFFGASKQVYPKLDIIEGVAFLGLDSMAEEVHWYDSLWANGELGKAQLTRLRTALMSSDVRACEKVVVYLHHHPFDPAPFHELKDAAALGEVLQGCAKRVDALLYGHNHQGKIRNGKWGIPRCYDAGSSTRKLGSSGFHRIIDLSRDARFDYDANFHCEQP